MNPLTWTRDVPTQPTTDCQFWLRGPGLHSPNVYAYQIVSVQGRLHKQQIGRTKSYPLQKTDGGFWCGPFDLPGAGTWIAR